MLTWLRGRYLNPLSHANTPHKTSFRLTLLRLTFDHLRYQCKRLCPQSPPLPTTAPCQRLCQADYTHRTFIAHGVNTQNLTMTLPSLIHTVILYHIGTRMLFFQALHGLISGHVFRPCRACREHFEKIEAEKSYLFAVNSSLNDEKSRLDAEKCGLIAKVAALETTASTAGSSHSKQMSLSDHLC